MTRRSVLVLAGWLAAALVATGIGVGAVRLIGAGFTSAGGDVLTPGQVAEQLAAPTPSSPPASSMPAPPSGEPGAAKPLSGPGGTVVAVCAGSQAYLMSWTPAQGFRVERVERGPYEHAEVRFEGSAGRSEVRVRCAGGEPSAQWTD